MNRRNFLKALGVGSGASALGACGTDDNRYYTPIEQLLPYVVRPEQVTPGTSTFFATTPLTGPDAYPMLANHRDGRVINVAANRQPPADPAVPSSAFFELQRLYSPDRVAEPQLDGAAATWDDALKRLADGVSAARAAGKKVAWLGRYRAGALAALLDAFTDGNAHFWQPLGRDAEAAAAEQLFGARALPAYDIENAHYVLSFGAEFLGGDWGGAWSQAAFARARSLDHGQFLARLAVVSPYRGQAAANADDWHAVVPGSEAQVALAVAKLVAAAKRYTGPARPLLQGGDPAKAAAAAGVDVSVIEGLAAHFAATPSVALPGGTAGASAAATQLAAAVFLLNIVSGHALMREGGYTGAIDGFGRIEALIADMKAGRVGALLLGEANPVHGLPRAAGFAEALGSVDLVAALSSHPDETSAAAKLVLPTSTAFEDWGDEEPRRGFHLLRQPAMSPLHDTRSIGDILLDTWRTVDAAQAPADGWRDYLKRHWSERLYPSQAFWDEVGGFNARIPQAKLDAFLAPADDAPAPPPVEQADEAALAAEAASFERWWESRLMAGFYLHPVQRARPVPAVTGRVAFTDAPTLADGDLHLLVVSHATVGDGRYADQPWAQEISDPLSGMVWDSWVLVHPDTAAAKGLTDNDLVTLTSPAGSIELGVEIQPLVRPDTVVVAFGQGHTAGGRYADGIGRNVVDLLGVTTGDGGVLALQQTRVQLAAAGRPAGLVSTFGADDDANRGFAARVAAAKLVAEHGDAPSDHPGSLTGIHHLALDKRLQKAGITDFYGEPDHPNYRFAMTVDTDACTGCGVCIVACYAENNIPVVGKHKVGEGRELTWIRINRYFKDDEVHFVPMMCQQCGHAPCESVCPVLATYHNIDGLNSMIYNRCVGTRYCSNACPYSVRRFNYHTYVWPEPLNLQLNPDVSCRTMGVMEKCTFCAQRIRSVKDAYRDQGFDRKVPDAALRQLTACADACPSQAITFGNRNDPDSVPARTSKSARNYIPIADLNTMPAVNYLAKASFHHDPTAGHGGGDHSGGHDGGEGPSHDAGGH